jgi:arylsulfatase A-like enzyme
VLILTDDQRYDELSGMPIVNSELVDKGLSFTNGFVEDPLCCPSRATILTGRESNSTDVYDNKPPHGGYATFHSEGEESSTIATWLHGAGYYTGLVGKYFNGYTPSRALSVPPGWDVWDGVANGAGPDGPGGGMYYQYYVSENGNAPLLRQRSVGLLHRRAGWLRDQVHHERAVEPAAVPVLRSPRAAPSRPGRQGRPEHVPGPRAAPSSERERGRRLGQAAVHPVDPTTLARADDPAR